VQFEAFRPDAKEVIKRALDLKVWLINVGTQKDTSEAAIKLAQEYPEGVYATVGLHPIHTSKSFHDSEELGNGDSAKEFTSRGEDFDYEFYKNLALDDKVVGVGECGLDYYRLEDDTKRKQAEIFEKQIALSSEIKKPLMIHCREAFNDLISILKTSKLNRTPGVVHFFSGTTDNAKELMDLGFSFSFGGVTTFAREYEKLIKYIPLDKILLETDAPYVAPIPYRGKRNEPSYVIEVANKISRIKNIPVEEIAENTFQNASVIIFLEK
jgi:TatD DNase family protein